MRQRLRLLLYALAIGGPNVPKILRQCGFRRGARTADEAPRLLFYAVNGVGLGHATRLLGIARQIRKLEPRAEILFLTSSEAAHLLYREGFAVVKTPSHSVAAAGLLPEKLLLPINHSAAWAAILSFDPHCLVVDTFPAGIQEELLAFLHGSLRKVFVFRAQRAAHAEDAFLQHTLRRYDLILVPHAPGSEIVPTPPQIETLSTGPMIAHEAGEMLSRADARAELGLPPDGFIGLMTIGGGGETETANARAQMRAAVANLDADALWVEVQGPLARVTSMADQPSANWRVLREVHPLMLYMNAFDGAVSAVGYNTTQELQAARLPAILWPFTRNVDDQGERARRLAEAGRALCIGEGAGEDRVEELTGALRELMQPATREQLRAAMSDEGTENGAAVGARAILKLITQP